MISLMKSKYTVHHSKIVLNRSIWSENFSIHLCADSHVFSRMLCIEYPMPTTLNIYNTILECHKLQGKLD